MYWSISPVYAGYGGTTNLTLTNEGATTVHVSGFGLEWIGSGLSTYRNDNMNVTPGHSVELGLLFFKAGNATGDLAYRINLKLAVMSLGGNWYDYGIVHGSERTVTVDPSLTYRNYTVTYNNAHTFDRINSLADLTPVTALARGIQGNATYNIQQVCDAYDWVHQNIAYLDDPADYWQSTSETLSLRTGDCEDQAILVAAIITAMGGTARVNLVEGHAFPTVYIGTDTVAVFSVDGAVESHYGTALTAYFLHDSTGYWMVVDTTGFPYAGGLPTTAGPVIDGTSAWTFESTDYLIAIDVMP
jgi:transglutaminase-like putative cysteine protease